MWKKLRHILKDISIQSKLSWIIMSVTTLALIIAGAVTLYIDQVNFKKKIHNELIILADIIGDNNTANLLFQAPAEIEKSLFSLKFNSDVAQSCIYDTTGKILAAYFKTGIPTHIFPLKLKESLRNQPVLNQWDKLEVCRPIYLDKQKLGSIYISAHTDALTDRSWRFIATSLLILIVTLLIAYFVTQKLQKIISDPIIQLASIEQEISEKKDFSIRIQETRKDEIGKTINAFNEMLDQIEAQNKELILAKDNAIRSEQAKEIFLANMSHEIRTPLNAILGFGHLLNQTPQNSEQNQLINGINTSGGQLLQIINDILDISKIQSGKMTIESTLFSLHQTVQEIFQVMQYKALEKKLDLNYHIHDQVQEFLRGDPLRLKQILLNLISNAIKFTDQGSIHLEINLYDKNSQIQTLEFHIIDTGIGINSDTQHKIFENFTQADSKTSRVYGGTGLGLSICKQLVELQQGKIWVESTLGKGSSFIFQIPYSISSKELFKTSNTTEEQKYYQFKDVHILCADDYALNLLLLNTLLKKHRITFDNAENGERAVNLAERTKYDLIFMDVQMPVMDGIKASHLIRREETINANTPIIGLTANALLKNDATYYSSGMNDFMLKPFSENLLIEKIAFHVPKKTRPLSLNDKTEDTSPPSMFHSLYEMLGHDQPSIQQILKQYLIEWTDALGQLEESFKNQNHIEVSAVIHKIKPSVAYVGLTDYSNLIERIEALPSFNESLLQELIQGLREALGLISKEIKQV